MRTRKNSEVVSRHVEWTWGLPGPESEDIAVWDVVECGQEGQRPSSPSLYWVHVKARPGVIHPQHLPFLDKGQHVSLTTVLVPFKAARYIQRCPTVLHINYTWYTSNDTPNKK